MIKQKTTINQKLIQALWLFIAVTSGFSQLVLIVSGGLFLSELYEWKPIKMIAIIAAFWSLFWPFYAYLGMNHAYRQLLASSRHPTKRPAQSSSAGD